MIYILPGFSPHNRTWAQAMAQSLASVGLVETVRWPHWETGKITTGWIEAEVDKLVAKIDDQTSLVAKSIGTYVAAKIVVELPTQIKKLVFCGLPLNDLKPDEQQVYRHLGKLKPEQVLVLQNSHDPHGSDLQVKQLFQKLNLPHQVKTLEGDTHEYLYPDQIQAFIE